MFVSFTDWPKSILFYNHIKTIAIGLKHLQMKWNVMCRLTTLFEHRYEVDYEMEHTKKKQHTHTFEIIVWTKAQMLTICRPTTSTTTERIVEECGDVQ